MLASYRLTFGASFAAALLNGLFGLVVAWVLVRYEFPFKRVVDALVDLPFALPTAVAGIALTAIYAQNGWIGQWLPFKVSFTPVGVFVALTFIGLPFVVRTLQPVLEDMQKELEEAAATLGASRWQTFTPTSARYWPIQPLAAYSEVSAMPATAVGNANGRSTSASSRRLPGKL